MKAYIHKGNTGMGKLELNWQGPYRVEEVIGPAMYRLSKTNGKPLPRMQNTLNLKKFYQKQNQQVSEERTNKL